MAVVGELLVLVGANNAGLTTALAKSQAELKTFSATAGVLAAGAAVGVVAAAVGLMSLNLAKTREEAINDIRTTADLSEQAASVVEGALEVAARGTTSSATEMAQALGPVAGELQRVVGHTLTATDVIQTLTAAQNLAVSTNTDLEPSLKAITDLLLVYGLNASDAARVSDLLNSGSDQLGISADVLSAQFQKLQPRLVGSGVSMETVLAIAREMEPIIGTGQRAIMKLGGVLQAFIVPSTGAQKTLSKMGISLTDTSGKFIGFGPALDRINAALANTAPAERAAKIHAIFGSNAAIATALLEGGSAALIANESALINGGTAADEAGIKYQEAGSKAEIIAARFNDAFTALGTALMPILTQVLDTIVPIVQAFSDWMQANPGLAGSIIEVSVAVGILAGTLKTAAFLAGLLKGASGLGGIGGAAGGAGAGAGAGAAGAGGVVIGPLLPVAAAVAVTALSTADLLSRTTREQRVEQGGLRAQQYQGSAAAFLSGSLTGNPSAGRGPMPITITMTAAPVYLDGAKVGEIIDRRQYNTSSTISSGFAAEPSTVR